MDPLFFCLAAASRQWSSLPPGVARLIKRFAWPATPSAQAFKAAMVSAEPLVDDLPEDAWWGFCEDEDDTDVLAILNSPSVALRCCHSDKCRCFVPDVFLRWEIANDGRVFRIWDMQRLDCTRRCHQELCVAAVDSKDWKTRGIVREKLDQQEARDLYFTYVATLDYAQSHEDWSVIENFPLHLLRPPREYVPGVGVCLSGWPRLQARILDRP